MCMIEHIISNLKKVNLLDSIYIATSKHPDDQILSDIATKNKVNVYGGSENDILERLLHVGAETQADYVVRVTGDNIFTDTILLNKLIIEVGKFRPEYARVVGAPLGVSAEVISLEALKKACLLFDREKSEYLMWYMFDPAIFETLILDVSEWCDQGSTLTVDTVGDWNRTKFIFDELGFSEQIDILAIKELAERTSIPAYELSLSEVIKLPDGAVTYSEYMSEYKKRLAMVQYRINFTKEEYQNSKR